MKFELRGFLTAGLLLFLMAPVFAADPMDDLLAQHKGEKDYKKRAEIEKQIREIVRPAHASKILAGLEEPDTTTSYFLVSLLEREIGGDTGTACLKKLLKPMPGWMANRVVTALHRMGEKELAVKQTSEWVADPQIPANDRLQHVYALRTMRDPSSFPVLKKIVEEAEDVNLRKQAMQSLDYMKDPDLDTMLKEIAADEAHPLCKDARQLLVKRGDTTYADAMLAELKNGKLSYADASALISSIEQSGDRSYADDLREALGNNTDDNILTRLMQVLARWDDFESIGRIQELAESEKERVALAALDALQDLGAGSSRTLFQRLLAKSKNEKVRVRAAAGLWHMDDPSGAEVIRAAMKSSDVAVRREAVATLQYMRNRDSFEALADAMLDSDASVRGSASNGMIQLLRSLFPYREFDLESLGYDANTGADTDREAAVGKLRDWWKTNTENE